MAEGVVQDPAVYTDSLDLQEPEEAEPEAKALAEEMDTAEEAVMKEEDVVPDPEVPEAEAPAEDIAAAESNTHGVIVTTYNSAGSVSGMYSMDQAVATKQADGSWLVRMHQKSTNRNYLTFTDSQEAATAHQTDWYKAGGADGYWFTVRLNSLEEPVSVCFSSSDRIAEGKEWSTVQTLVFDPASLTDTEEPEVTAAEMIVEPAEGSGPATPDVPADPENPETPETPETPDTPENPDVPAEPENPENPENPDKPDSGEMEETPEAGEETRVPADGIYTGTAQTSAPMFKVTAVKLTSKKGQMKAVVTLSGTGYDYLFMGTKEEAYAAEGKGWIPAVADENGKYTYEIPVSALDTPLAVASRSARYAAEGQGADAWLDRTITINSDSLIRVGDVEEEKETLPDGIYSGIAETNAAMFKVVSTTLTSKKGEMKAVVTLSGTGYDYLFMGTKEEAFSADESEWIPAVRDEEGRYCYEIPVEALDTPLNVASRSARYAAEGRGLDAWMNRTITILGGSLEKTGDLPEDPADTPEESDKPSSGDKPSSDDKTSDPSNPSGGNEASGTEKPSKNDGVAENESKYESDLSGSTSAVNSSTSLKDGVYTPSSFSWSGGTGKVRISCNKVTVQGGKAYATIAFSSSKFGYVKANGNTYYPTVSGGSSIFTIPVELNRNNTIIGMTTAMSAAHEIAYNIFISIPGAGGTAGDTSSSASGMVSSDNSSLDEKAPEIVGLEYESETELEYAQYFKIYNYEKGITLVEVDVTKDTARDPELERDEKDTKESKGKKKAVQVTVNRDDSSKEKAGVQDSLEEGETLPSEEETTAELYTGNVIKYLIVPEKEEIPVGLEKDMIVVQLPAEEIYEAAETGYAFMKDLDCMDLIGSVAVKEKDCKDKEIAKAMKDGEVIYGGKAEKPVYKDLLRSKTDLAIMPASMLPGNKDVKTADGRKIDKKKLTSYDEKELEKETEQLEKLTEHFALLGIPLVFDRSEDEVDELAKEEWIKVYGALVDKQQEAEKLFEKTVKENK